VHPDEQLQVHRQWQQALATRRPMQLEARLGGANGYRTFVVKATPIVQGDVIHIKWLGACADIEEQKLFAAEKEMQARQKSFFLNALSHDLRAPLNNVVLNAHLLKMSIREEAEVESVSMIMENAVAAGHLVTKLLDFAKVGAKDDNVVEDVSVALVLQQVVRRFGPLAEQKGLYLRTEGDPDVRVATDRHKLERILSNLVENAIKYTSCGGVVIALTQEPGRVSFKVTDTGIGVAPQNVPFLFDEFYQANNFERDRSKGFGMGLAICRSLARHLGGDIKLAATSGEGSCFEFSIHNLGADCRGRSGGADGDRPAAAAAGLCRV
jgi:signal transduction histidine kinase